MDVSAAFPAEPETAEEVQPGEGALDDPAAGAESGSVFALATGDGGLDAPAAELSAVLVVVIAAVGDQLVGTQAGGPTLPRTGPAPSMRGSGWVTSLRLPP